MENLTLKEQFEREIAIQDNDKALHDLLDEQLIMDIADLIETFPEEGNHILSLLSAHRAVSAFKILDFSLQEELIEDLPENRLREIINELPPDDRTSLLEELPERVAKEMLKLLSKEELEVTLKLLGYPEESVGRRMTPDYLDVKEEWTVRQALDHIRKYGKDSETIDMIYVIDKNGKLIDDLRIREFLLVDPDKKISDLIDGRYTSLRVTDTQEEAIVIFRKENRVALPVINSNQTLLGIVTIDDILQVASDEYTEDLHLMGGTATLEEPYLDINIFKLFRKRGGVLVILFLGEMLTATAMQHYSDTGIFENFPLLILFIPLIIASGGNSGSQATTLIVRAIALGEVTFSHWWKIAKREVFSGLMLGTLLGTVGFIRIYVWQISGMYDYGEHYMLLSLTIFFALIGVVLWGSISGGMLPLLLKKLGFDPATSSAPFVATLVDVTGIIIYISIAMLMLRNIL